MTASSIRVLTYNIHKGFNFANRRFVLHEMREHLHIINVDIVFLQEILGAHDYHQKKIYNWPLASQLEFLADQLWPHMAYGKNAIYQAGHHGNAILSKYPFSRWENVNLSSFRRASRSLLHGVICIPGIDRPVHVICVHLDMIGMERKRQHKILSRHIDDLVPADEPLILAGDFNDWNQQLGRQLEADLGLHEAFYYIHGRYAKTYPVSWPVLSMDRIYFRNLSFIECTCLDTQPWKSLSDHAPLYAQLGYTC